METGHFLKTLNDASLASLGFLMRKVLGCIICKNPLWVLSCKVTPLRCQTRAYYCDYGPALGRKHTTTMICKLCTTSHVFSFYVTCFFNKLYILIVISVRLIIPRCVLICHVSSSPGTKRDNEWPCPLGTFGNATGYNSTADCSPCLGGMYCGIVGKTVPTAPCSAGYYCRRYAETSTPNQSTDANVCPQGG